jgi:capsular exopolysaccharide synthesis family protein
VDLSGYLAVLRRRWITLVVCLVLGAAAGAAYGALTPKEYASSAQVIVSARAGVQNANDLAQGGAFARDQVTTYAQLVSTPTVLQPVIDELGLGTSLADLAKSIKAEVPLNTSLITLTATSGNPEQAARVADATSRSLIKTIDTLEQQPAASPQAPPGPPQNPGPTVPVAVTVVRAAVIPTTPTSTSRPLALTLGLLAGLVLGLSAAGIRQSLDTRIRTEEDLAKIGLPVLGSIPRDREMARNHVGALAARTDTPRAEALRRLRVAVQKQIALHGIRSLMITSPSRGDGRTATAVGLALALAEAGVRVALLEADLRNPDMDRQVEIEGRRGLVSVLRGETTLDGVIHPVGNTHCLDVVLCGPIPANPSELLSSPVMQKVVEQLEHGHELVVVDTPEAMGNAEGLALSRVVDCVVMLTRESSTRRAVDRMHTLFARNGDSRFVGVALNEPGR